MDFSFTDSRLTRLNYVLETRGDAKLDEAVLEALKTKCDKLALSAKQLSGISVSCYEESGVKHMGSVPHRDDGCAAVIRH